MRAVQPIPLLDLKAQFAGIRDEVFRVMHDVCDAQAFILGPGVETFERDVAAYLHARHAIGCASGTDALILSLAAAGIGPGDEVLTTPFSFFASASCAVRVGARPRFADIQEDSFNLDPERVEAAITPRTRAIVPVHLFGQCADMDAILEIARRREIVVVEDACQSLGASYLSKREGTTAKAGTLGDFGTYSFFPSKNLGGFGDGGLLVARDESKAARARMLRVHGERERYKHQLVGWNSRLDALQAAVLRVKLPHLDEWSQRRASNADRYDRLFRESGLVDRECVKLPARLPYAAHIFNQYTLRARDRDRLGEHLKAHQIGWAIYYPIPLHLQECFRDAGYRAGDMPVTERVAAEVISIPVYPELTPAMQERVVEAIAAFYAR